MKPCNHHERCIDTALHNAQDLCIKHNMHFTPLRRQVLKLIWQNHIPLKVHTIVEKLKLVGMEVKPISVYRVLDFMQEYGLVHKLTSQNSFLGCSHPSINHNCYFIICQVCYKVEEACQEDVLNNIHMSLDKKNFLPKHITLEIQGICQECQN